MIQHPRICWKPRKKTRLAVCCIRILTSLVNNDAEPYSLHPYPDPGFLVNQTPDPDPNFWRLKNKKPTLGKNRVFITKLQHIYSSNLQKPPALQMNVQLFETWNYYLLCGSFCLQHLDPKPIQHGSSVTACNMSALGSLYAIYRYCISSEVSIRAPIFTRALFASHYLTATRYGTRPNLHY